MRGRTRVAGFVLALLCLPAMARRGDHARRPEPPPTHPGRAFELVYAHTVSGNADIYAVSTERGLPRRLTRDPAGDGLPRWSRDGRRVFFTSDRSGNWQIYETGPGGGPARRVRTNAHREWQVDPSPDGRSIAFLSNAQGPEFLFVQDLAAGQERALARHGRRTVMGNPHWSPDGGRIVFSTNWPRGHGIHVVDAATGRETPLDRTLRGACEPRFHPDGRRVVYVSRGGHARTSRLVEHDLTTGAKTTLVAWPALNYSPVYAPDGSEIAFSSNLTGEWVVYRLRFSDGRAFRVTTGEGSAGAPDYRP
jgi:Tol biopolymer transport system component